MTGFLLKPASDLSYKENAELLSRSFEGYIVPIQLNESQLITMIRRDSIDLAVSRIVYKDTEPIGIGLIARRGWTCRLAAMGIAANERGSGAGTWFMKQLIDEARKRGDREMTLEVIEQNTAGVKLYEKTGFEKTRRLVGYKIENPKADTAHALEEIDIRELARMVTYHGLKDLPWQLSGTTLMHYTPPARAFKLNDAYCLISDPSAGHVVIASVLVKTRSRGAGLSGVLMRALFSKFPGKTWHVPAFYPEEMAFIFEHANMQREEISQWQMTLKL